MTPAVATTIAAVPAADIATAVLAGGTVPVTVKGRPDGAVPVGADDVIVNQTPRAGWAVAAGTAKPWPSIPSPRNCGAKGSLARSSGLSRRRGRMMASDVTDRISLRWSASDPDLAAALTEHASLIAGEVLAAEYGLAGVRA